MGRPSLAETRRAELADALLGLMSRARYGELTVSAIAEAAQLAPGLIHHYFSSKDDVLALAVQRASDTLAARIAARLDAAGTHPLARVEAVVDAWLATGADAEPAIALAWATIGDEARHHEPVRVLYQRTLATARETLVREVSACLPAPRRRRAPRIALTLQLAIEGAIRTGAAGGIEPGTAAPIVRRLARDLLG